MARYKPVKTTVPLFASTHLHDLLSPFDPLDVYADMLYLNEHGHWHGEEVPEWCDLLADQFGTTPALIVAGSIGPWLLDQAVNGGYAGQMAEMGQRETGEMETDAEALAAGHYDVQPGRGAVPRPQRKPAP